MGTVWVAEKFKLLIRHNSSESNTRLSCECNITTYTIIFCNFYWSVHSKLNLKLRLITNSRIVLQSRKSQP